MRKVILFIHVLIRKPTFFAENPNSTQTYSPPVFNAKVRLKKVINSTPALRTPY